MSSLFALVALVEALIEAKKKAKKKPESLSWGSIMSGVSS